MQSWVAEKAFTCSRRNFVFQSSVWHPELELARRNASQLARNIIARRVFIGANSSAAQAKSTVVEKVELPRCSNVWRSTRKSAQTAGALSD